MFSSWAEGEGVVCVLIHSPEELPLLAGEVPGVEETCVGHQGHGLHAGLLPAPYVNLTQQVLNPRDRVLLLGSHLSKN